ncbi:hypothetical protein [Evansella clarkii]|uniref:hypothetical protein n=1 Tax=Evansella clarkii TaxID=79879 RepID=UPI000B43B2E9|nr:hypothetical protein [Evansella clarkii]
MPIIRVLLTGLAKLLSKVFSMATLTFFGRVPSKDDSKISFMGLLSLYWIYISLSVIFPDLAEYFIPFLPDDDMIIRIIALLIWVLIPLVIGYTSTKLENRHPDHSRVKQTLMGFPYALVLGLLSMALIIVIPILKMPNYMKRHVQEQFAIMIREGKYEDVLDEIVDILESHDLKAEVKDTEKVARWTFMVLTRVMERIFNNNFDKKMKYIKVKGYDDGATITLHATDLSIVGPKKAVYFLKHVLSEEIEPENLYFTWDDPIREKEEEIRNIKNRIKEKEETEDDLDRMHAITRELRETPMSNEDWNSVRRQLYKLEIDYYKNRVEEQESSSNKRDNYQSAD